MVQRDTIRHLEIHFVKLHNQQNILPKSNNQIMPPHACEIPSQLQSRGICFYPNYLPVGDLAPWSPSGVLALSTISLTYVRINHPGNLQSKMESNRKPNLLISLLQWKEMNDVINLQLCMDAGTAHRPGQSRLTASKVTPGKHIKVKYLNRKRQIRIFFC